MINPAKERLALDRQPGAGMVDALPVYQRGEPDGSSATSTKVFELARPGEANWRWNDRAVASLALFGHTIGSDTLCTGIERISAGRVADLSWDNDPTIDRALEALRIAFRDCVDGAKTVHLSLSAGYDSRLLLALCVSEGVRPELSVMGYDDSTDVVVARALAQEVGLPIQIVELKTRDYLDYGPQISFDTSGVKTAVNWHTWLYSKYLGASDGIHLVGSNGEFARSFFFDHPKLNPIGDRLPTVAAEAYWITRLSRRKGKFSRHNPIVHGKTANVVSLAHEGMARLGWGPRNFSQALDCFYTQQRVRHFIGGGLACYSQFGRPRSPFLDDRWMRTAAQMARPLKHNSFFHAESTRRLAPELAWLPYNQLAGGGQGRSYHPFTELCSLREVEDIISESTHLDYWATPSERRSILSDKNCSQVEERNLWLTLHFAASSSSSFA